MRLNDLIAKAEGITGDAYLERVSITRINADFSNTFITKSLANGLDNKEKENIILKSGDLVTIHKFSDMVYSAGLEIVGHVYSPGRKDYKKGTTVADLIFLAGGFNID